MQAEIYSNYRLIFCENRNDNQFLRWLLKIVSLLNTKPPQGYYTSRGLLILMIERIQLAFRDKGLPESLREVAM